MLIRCSRLAAAAALLAAAAAANAADVGARVLLQQWDPRAPQQQTLRTLSDDPGAVSDAVQALWREMRTRICDRLIAEMGKGGVAAGQTLHDITCKLDEAATFKLESTGVNALAASVAVSGEVKASVTTPTILGKGADPRLSLALTGRVVLALTVQPNPAQTLRADKASFTLSNAKLDTHNLTGDVLKWAADDLVPYFGGPNYRQLAENAVNGVGIDFTRRFNAALAPVNAKLVGPSNAVRVGVWAKPDAIVVAFAPRELAPPGGGTVSGVLRWEAGKLGAPANCDSFSVAASVQIGPAPLRDPNGHHENDAPRRKVGSFERLPSAAGECRYRLSGLAAGWPNDLKAASSIGAGKTAGNSIHSLRYTVVGEGWDGRTVTPQPSADRNYVVRAVLEGTDVADPAGALLKRRGGAPGDPRIDPARPGATQVVTPYSQSHTAPSVRPGLGAAAAAARTGTVLQASGTSRTGLQRGDAVSLNPQPLPPGALQPTAPESALGTPRVGALR